MTTVRIDIPEEQAAELRDRAREQGVSAEEYVRQALIRELGTPRPARRHISEIIRERMARVPSEIMAAMPEDGASQHDHYIYGLPKREQ